MTHPLIPLLSFPHKPHPKWGISVNSRDIHQGLGLQMHGPTWAKQKIAQLGFVEGVDYESKENSYDLTLLAGIELAAIGRRRLPGLNALFSYHVLRIAGSLGELHKAMPTTETLDNAVYYANSVAIKRVQESSAGAAEKAEEIASIKVKIAEDINKAHLNLRKAQEAIDQIAVMLNCIKSAQSLKQVG